MKRQCEFNECESLIRSPTYLNRSVIKISRFRPQSSQHSRMPDHTQNTVRIQTLHPINAPNLFSTQWPPELTHKVLTYLDSDDVARMARVGNTFQAEAERLLSRRRANWEKSLRKLDLYRHGVDVDPTTKNSGQGLRLQELIFWYPDEDTLEALDTLVTDQLCEGLLLMTSLKHLTIRLPGKPEFEVLENINSTLAYAPSWLILFITLSNFYQTLHVLLENTLSIQIFRTVSLDPEPT